MTKFKLSLTYEFTRENVLENEVYLFATDILKKVYQYLIPGKWEAALTREGDRSGANLLAPLPVIGNMKQHFKHHKIPIQDVLYPNQK